MEYIKLIKAGIAVVCGAGVGGAAGWYFTKRHYEKIMEDRIQEEVALEVKASTEYLSKLNDEHDNNDSVHESEIPVDETSTNSEESRPKELKRETAKEKFERKWPNWEQKEKEREEFMKNPHRVRYDKVGVDPEEEPVVDEELLARNNDDPDTSFEYPSGEELAQNRLGYDDDTLYWWPNENILTERDLSILDVPDILGPRWEEHLGEFDANTLYVINHNNKTCYDVIVQDGSLYDIQD